MRPKLASCHPQSVWWRTQIWLHAIIYLGRVLNPGGYNVDELFAIARSKPTFGLSVLRASDWYIDPKWVR